MSSPVVTVGIDDKIDKIASLMRSKKIGSVIVLDQSSRPIGIITERDIISRIVSKDIKPSTLKAKEIMSSPLHTIESTVNITEATKKMRDRGVRRLIVIKGTNLAGIVSSDDIARITPELIAIISEKSNFTVMEGPIVESGITGQCEKCENWSDDLKESEGLFLCEECYDK